MKSANKRMQQGNDLMENLNKFSLKTLKELRKGYERGEDGGLTIEQVQGVMLALTMAIERKEGKTVTFQQRMDRMGDKALLGIYEETKKSHAEMRGTQKQKIGEMLKEMEGEMTKRDLKF